MDFKAKIALFNIVFPSFFWFLFPFELSLVLSRNSQLHTACYKRDVFCTLDMQLMNGLKRNHYY